MWPIYVHDWSSTTINTHTKQIQKTIQNNRPITEKKDHEQISFEWTFSQSLPKMTKTTKNKVKEETLLTHTILTKTRGSWQHNEL